MKDKYFKQCQTSKRQTHYANKMQKSGVEERNIVENVHLLIMNQIVTGKNEKDKQAYYIYK